MSTFPGGLRPRKANISTTLRGAIGALASVRLSLRPDDEKIGVW
jgi:hypothetical protein